MHAEGEVVDLASVEAERGDRDHQRRPHANLGQRAERPTLGGQRITPLDKVLAPVRTLVPVAVFGAHLDH